MKLNFVKKSKDKGYFGKNLWLPKHKVNLRSIKSGLEFPVLGVDGMEYFQLWSETDDHIIVPREFIRRQDYKDIGFPIVDICNKRAPRVRIESKITLDFKKPELTNQRDAFDAMCASDGGVLNLACGGGKTVITLHHIAHRGVPALIIVNNTTLLDQWTDRIAQFLRVEGGVGRIQGKPNTWDWRGKAITVAMINTLALRASEIPPEMNTYFGGVYFDEVHHVSAPLFSTTAPLFSANRYGLTATAEREDGMEAVFQYNIGSPFYRDLMPELDPTIFFQNVPININVEDPLVRQEICDVTGKVHIGKLRTYLGTLEENNEFILDKIEEITTAGRKLLVLSHSVDQLKELNYLLKGSGLCTGEVPPLERIETLARCRVTFGTLQLVTEALDEPTIDTLFFLTSFGSAAVEFGGMNTLQQGMGRAQRFIEGKKKPIIVIFDYINIPKMSRMCRKLKQVITDWPVDRGGPLEYTVVKS